MSVLSEVYYAMLDTPYFMPDDAWLGIIWEKLGIEVRDTHRNFAGISSYRKELRIIKLFTSGRFFEKKIYATILDYAYDHDDIASKLIEVWFAFKYKQRQLLREDYMPIEPHLVVMLTLIFALFLVTKLSKHRLYAILCPGRSYTSS